MKSGLWLLTLGCFTLIPLPSHAQISPDNSLGAENSQINPNATINGNPATQIEGGATRGSNLFHSFQDFNVNLGQQVYFANPADITDIFTRVTGNNPSNILGTLGVDGAANLFLLNPNGIIFGANAQLDIRGSFVASTADSILFDNGIEFSATNPQAPPLLTINVPLGLQRGNNNATITNRGNLSVGGNFTLDATNLNLQGQLHAGGDLTLQATDTLTIRDTESNPFIATAYGALVVQGNQTVDIFALNHADSGFYSYGNMTFRSDNPVGGDAHYWSGGNFRIERLDGSVGDLYSPYDPIIVVDGNVDITNYTGASLHILATGSVNVDSATITGSDPSPFAISKNHNNPAIAALATVSLPDGTTYDVDGQNRPTLDIRSGVDPATVNNLRTVLNALNPAPPPRAFYPLPPPAGTVVTGLGFNAPANPANVSVGNLQINSPGNSGDIIITSTQGIDLNNSVLNTGLSGTNDGNIIVSGANGINLNGDAQINANNNIKVYGNVNGNSNNLNLTAGNDVLVNNEVDLGSTTVAGGNLTVNADNNITINQLIDTRSTVSNSGNVSLTSNTGTAVINGDLFTTSTAGNSGNVSMNIHGDITVTGDIDTSSTSGNAGNIAALSRTGNINFNNAQVVAQSLGIGNSGAVQLNALSGQISLDNTSRVITTTRGSGNAGRIDINARRFSATNNSGVYANTAGTGNANDINFNVADSVIFDRSFAFANTFQNTGNAGRIIVNTNQLTAQNGSFFSVASQGQGNGGAMLINARDSMTLIGNDERTISATNKVSSTAISLGSFGGSGAGSLEINTSRLVVRNGALIYGSVDANSAGNAANMTIRASEFVEVIGTTPNNQLQSSISSDTFGAGNAGNLQIFTPTLSVLDGGKISAGTTGTGRAGTLSINNANRVEVRGTSANGQLISTIVYDSFGAGDAGELTINSQRVMVQNGGRISARTGGLGRGGAINVNAPDSLHISGRSPNGQASGLFFNSEGSGDARGINVNTGVLRLSDGGQMNVGGAGAGTAGDIVVKATSIFMNNGSRITAETSANGGGGNIRLEVADIIWLRNDSDIRTDARGVGLGGNIDITAEAVLAILGENSDVIARSELNQGGRITVNAKLVTNFRLYQDVDTPESDLTANSVFGVDGTVDLFTNDLQLEPGLPESPRDVQIRQNCQANREGNTPAVAIAELYITGRGGMSPNPSNPLSSGGMSVPFAQSFASVTGENSNAMVEAGGLVRLPNGEVILASSELLGEIDLSLACTQR
ncbi:MAG: filamentous hemagglutinin N-terminal domain-containing protein [Jaaginema sp. PMC 1079.18]|nr:filamentous hemagglutinin N-terminal domain-containing protein [Jaaginema sp. PMC 1080.18]MEC4851952.1 filamentous hemagglutinin N-terminal domain-containing protein [Jaaginema sp. PMC 1079.18]MEC4866918.1 filamentous hemagglutinin N-terminal domain-containing protein [Jaaginema sp. PMC 1078.18]